MGRLLVGVWLLAAHAIGSGASPLMSPERMAVHGTEGNATNGTHMVITGAPTAKLASGAVPVRRNIVDLHDKYPDQFNLYILGLREFYEVDENDDFSFYKIAGIHGRPYGPWQGAEGIEGKEAGWCPHSIILFMGWHRAYLLLYEQLLVQHVQDIAQRFSPELRQRYVAAASEFRIPYWDWALMATDTTHPIPTWIAEQETIMVVATDGSQQSVQNPLHHFDFHPCEPVPGTFDGKWQYWTKTLRHPSSDDNDAHSRPEVLYEQFLARNEQLHSSVGSDMQRQVSFNTYSKQYLEMSHNLVHNIAGGGMNGDDDRYWGHMDPIEYSAFDPIFWLHHTNVDRLFAIYQSINPTRWLTPDNVYSSGTYGIADYSVVDSTTPLAPFWKAPGTFFSSSDLRDTVPWGYAYPETQSWLYKNGGNGTNSTQAFQESVTKEVARLYSPDWRAKLQGAGTTRFAPNTVIRAGKTEEWAVQISVPKKSLAASISVNVFLTPAGGERKQLRTVAVMMPETAAMSMGSEGESTVVSATVALTSALVDEIVAERLDSLEKEAVGKFLPGVLGWKLVSNPDSGVQMAAVPLTVMVLSAEVTVPPDPSKALSYGSWVEHPEIVLGNAV